MAEISGAGRFARIGRSVVLALVVAAIAMTAPSARAAISAGLAPASQTVPPGTDFDLYFDATAAGSAFNGFDLVVSYDPAALTFVPLSPTTLQQGCLMTGSCSAACGSTFHLFSAAADSMSVSDVLLCNQTFLNGPGHLYKLRFHASNTIQVTHVLVRRTNFYNAGLFVMPVSTNDATIGIGVTLGVTPSGPAGAGHVRVEPNPTLGRVAFSVEGGGTAGLDSVEILDLQGRVVRALAPGGASPSARITWDGRDAHGALVPAGVYQARIHRNGKLESTRVVLLP